ARNKGLTGFCPKGVGANRATLRLFAKTVFQSCIFGDYPALFANKFAPTASGQNQKQTCYSDE
ncbi:hypothetical protein, partial [Pseudomonas fragariae (ex Marin et al. 2024)]